MELFSPGGVDEAPWDPEPLYTATQTIPEVRSLSLTDGRNLYNLHKYVSAMRLAVQLGVAEEGSVVPDLKWARSKRNSTLVAIRKRNQLAGATADSVGVSRDIPSFSLAALGKSSLDHFDHLVQLRKQDNYVGDAGLDLACTSMQRMNLVIPSAEDVRIGKMLKDAKKTEICFHLFCEKCLS